MANLPKNIKRFLLNRDQSGMSSFIIVATLAIILSLISLGAVRISNRNLSSSLSNQVSQAAELAAESGVNQVVKHLSGSQSYSSCTAGNNAYFTGSNPPVNLSPSPDLTTAITCTLVDSHPTSLAYQNVSTGSSRVIQLKVQSGILGSILISWSYHRPDPNNPGTVNYPPSPATSDLNTELTWNSTSNPNNNYPPVLQVTFYPVQASGTSVDQISSKTFYLVPFATNSGSTVTATRYTSTSSGSIVNADCAATVPPSGAGSASYNFSPDTSYDCNAIVWCLNPNPCGSLGTNNDHYDLKILPVYKNADVKIQAKVNTTGTTASFQNAQTVIDVTAKSGVARRRIQARVTQNTTIIQGQGAGYTNPDYALRSAGTLCKRLAINGSGVYSPNPNEQQYCQGGISYPGSPPGVSLKADQYTINKGGTVTLTWTVSGTATSCESYQDGTPDWLSPASKSISGGSQVVGPISATQKYTIKCDNSYGSNTSSVTINVPSVTLTANSSPGATSCPSSTLNVDYQMVNGVLGGQQFTLCWITSPAGYSFPGNGGFCNTTPSGVWPGNQAGGGGGTITTGPINRDTTYTVTCYDSGWPGDGNTYTASITINVNSPTFNLTPLTQSASYGNNVTIGWYGPSSGQPIWDADSCTPTSSPNQGSWNGYGGWLNGAGQMAFSVTQAFSVTLQCTGDNGAKSNSKTSNVTMTPSTLFMSSNPSTVDYGQASTLSWGGNDIVPGSCRSGGSSPSDPGWNFSGKNAPGSQSDTIPQPNPKPTTYTVTCTRGDNGSSISASAIVNLNPPSLTLAPTYSIASSNCSKNNHNTQNFTVDPGVTAHFTVYYGGGCNSYGNPQLPTQGIGNADSCTPTSNPTRNNWQLGPNNNGIWPTTGTGSVNMGYANSTPGTYTIVLQLQCTGGGGITTAISEVIVTVNNPGSSSSSSSSSSSTSGGNPPIQINMWAGNTTYYAFTTFSSSSDCYYSSNNYDGNTSSPYNDGTSHVFFQCSITVQVSQYGYGDSRDQNLSCSLYSNGVGIGTFTPPNSNGWIQWNGNNLDGFGTHLHALGPNTNMYNGFPDDRGWEQGWGAYLKTTGPWKNHLFPDSTNKWADNVGNPVIETEFKCFNNAGDPPVYECMVSWPFDENDDQTNTPTEQLYGPGGSDQCPYTNTWN